MRKIFVVGVFAGLVSLLSIDATYAQCGSGRCGNGRRGGAPQQNGWTSQEGGFQGPYRGNYPGTYNEENGYPEFRTEDDHRLYKKIKGSIHNYFSGKYDNLWIALNDGNVLIRGNVENERDSNDLMGLLRDMRGINNINNQLQIGRADRNASMTPREERDFEERVERRQELREERRERNDATPMPRKVSDTTSATSNDRYTTPADRQILKNLRSDLSSYDNLSLNVNNGDVVLSGSVDSAEDKEKIEKKVRATDGVRNIKNEIVVSRN